MMWISQAHTEALGVLYDRYGRLVYTVAIHVVGDAETAEEITQDVFVRAWEGAHTYRPDMAKVSSWLVSIARHRAIDELRRRGVRPEKVRSDWPEDVGQENIDGLPVLDGPEEVVENVFQQHGIRKAVSSLPPDQRQVLGLAYFKGLSHSQIAELLGEPLGTVKSRIRLAMMKLREAWVEKGIVEP
jgi:RNA polymerase sigma-70 factor (ECF subfamily)